MEYERFGLTTSVGACIYYKLIKEHSTQSGDLKCSADGVGNHIIPRVDFVEFVQVKSPKMYIITQKSSLESKR